MLLLDWPTVQKFLNRLSLCESVTIFAMVVGVKAPTNRPLLVHRVVCEIIPHTQPNLSTEELG